MTPDHDTDRSGPPEDGDLLEAIAGDLADLEAAARCLGDGLHEIIVRLQKQADARRGTP